MPTYLGMPPFPEAAKAALADSQFRHNLAHATGVIPPRAGHPPQSSEIGISSRDAGRAPRAHRQPGGAGGPSL